MKTITVQVGNSDDKLSQLEWSHFVAAVQLSIEETATEIHFSGGSSNWDPWQNMAWVFVCGFDDYEQRLEQLKQKLVRHCQSFSQDSIAWTEGVTEFVTAKAAGCYPDHEAFHR